MYGNIQKLCGNVQEYSHILTPIDGGGVHS
jgi:hypothetical protein